MGKVFLITGEKAEGKTSFLVAVIQLLKAANINCWGFYSKGWWKNNIRSGFDLVSINDESHLTLCTKDPNPEWIKLGPYFFNPEAITFAEELLKKPPSHSQLLVIDEVGKLELQKKIWYNSIHKLIKRHNQDMIWCVREKFVTDILDAFNVEHYTIYNIRHAEPLFVSGEIIKYLSQK